jgi:diguanylate cyclase (GGDEF)-like protein/PAS domain S-box-containing protein
VKNLDSELCREVLSLCSQGILIVDAADPGCEIVFVNAAYEHASGYSADDLIGAAWLRFSAADEHMPEFVDLKQNLACRCPATATLPFLRKDGEIWLTRFRMTPLAAGNPDQKLMLIEHTSAEQTPAEGGELLKRALGMARQKIASLDRTDPMTGLLSQAQFVLMLRREIAVCRRESQTLELLLFSIPDLEIYRSTFGHKAANSCLRMISAQVAGTFRRASDLSARIDESTLAVAIRGQDREIADMLIRAVENKARNLGLHNPRGKFGRYLVVKGASVTADTAADDADSLMQRCRAALESRDYNPPLSVAELA